MFRRVVTRVAAPAGAVGLAAYAGITTVNDDWDEVIGPATWPQRLLNDSQPPPKERIVVVGSGWGAVQTLRKLRHSGADVVVVSPRPHFVYTPLLAGSTVGTVSLRSVIEPIRDVVDYAAARVHSAKYVRAGVTDVDFDRKVVFAKPDDDSAVSISYDKLIIAVGCEPATFGIPGVLQHALFMKEASDADAVRMRILKNIEKAAALIASDAGADNDAELDRLLHVVVVGGGPTGVELTAELADFFRNDVKARYGPELASRCKISLVEALPRVLMAFDASLANTATKQLGECGVAVRVATAISGVKSSSTATVKASLPRSATAAERAAADAAAVDIHFGALVWAAGVTARPLTKQLAAKLGQANSRGLLVDSNLRVLTSSGVSDHVFAMGDCADSGLAPTAQVAAQQGRYLGRQLSAMGRHDTLAAALPFEYNHSGSMAFVGNHAAVAQLAAPPTSKTVSFAMWRFLHGAASTPVVGASETDRALTGVTAFLFWRGLYFAQLISSANRLSLINDWIKSETVGREVAVPQHAANLPVEAVKAP
ncbi:pyridine nucleotide-disulfide oxidoreductase-domain-containing protein [Pelagophyceae sp. CCMP2097]|nr:pyridine nucleotide-disulfide oxidoreductase-domain-containing protein [Pelagophyceae sp. CCMP2097]|mmetsp:Transcript_31692/g.106762  ORF Transcript_31692/g.106762 Transcript_31692/m.106762 type:complete len:541 (-) Transcript_31692:50-1672(-)|eukprot:CAMPEP_0184245628 /NCGR_PEP_ID=MMETSP0977-20130417/1530_1 /TAXON_ID=483370 /ORGANISM="non described non described, Strain CCMP2097" /LENGTH=540 /DNA_ID=CAMNT_0026550931 /DNA_START=41 /DNA_END=1663 /DNA_ORIENTATION=+